MSPLIDRLVELIPLDHLRPYPGNPRTHSKQQIRQIAASIKRFGFTSPLLVSDDMEVIAGSARLRAAHELDMKEVPVIRLSHLNADERRAYVIADNQLALKAGWDQELLAMELQALINLDFEVEPLGFDVPEIDIILESHASTLVSKANKDDVVPAISETAVTRLGDIWQLGRHRLVCGDARDASAYDALLGDEEAGLIFTDPPYNVPIKRNVSGKGKVRHDNFTLAAGELSEAEFTLFLETSLGLAAARCRDGAIAYVCMDWRHMDELLVAGRRVFSALKNLCVWNKSLGSNGTFYRSKHELVFVFKVGTAPHINNFGLGAGGRYRTNVWDYAGANGFGANREDDLAMHPTVKPVELVKDAILDCSKRGDIILDCFAGSGTVLAAAHKVGRIARLIEYDPRYCDVIIQRFEKLTGQQAILVSTGQTSEEVADQRLGNLAQGDGQ
ncbi:COG0863 DNA modification methylase [Sphingomonadaceae bacterium]